MNYIVAVDKNWGIGKNNDLLFSLPSDMKHFRTVTSGKTVIMGRKTLLSLPNSAPLKNRRNIILTSDKSFSVDGGEVCSNIEEVLELVKNENPENVFVIGGALVYNQLYKYCKTAYITKAEADGNADVFIENLDKLPNWKISEQGEPITENGITYSFVNYTNTDI